MEVWEGGGGGGGFLWGGTGGDCHSSASGEGAAEPGGGVWG